MNAGKTVFAQLMDFIPLYEFRKCVEPYHGDYKVKTLFLLGPVPLHGLCAAHLPGEPTGYRGLSPGGPAETLPSGDTRQGLPKHPGQRQSGPGLAYLCRLCTGPDWQEPGSSTSTIPLA